ncbi:MAG: hypothetical protein EPN84_02305 [Legionella sp.]|nr:MAG: hypothetical protein EPN84_02305 [Legionella sp.]
MTQRLVWNFEFSTKKKFLKEDLDNHEKENLKWEKRAFWSHEEIIILNAVNPDLLNLTQYEQKNKEDAYYLLPDLDCNIKLRRNELLYKPLVKKTKKLLGFAAKINLSEHRDNPELLALQQDALTKAHIVQVKKEAFVYKFPNTPGIKLELARLEINQKIYFTACVEGRSLKGVETLSQHLLGKYVSCDYVSFLKKISDHD